MSNAAAFSDGHRCVWCGEWIGPGRACGCRITYAPQINESTLAADVAVLRRTQNEILEMLAQLRRMLNESA